MELGEEEYGRVGSRLTLLVGGLVFFDLVLWFAVAPLLPGWEESLGLSKAQSGIVVGAYSAAVLLASVPAGSLADKFGPRRVTIAATLLFAIAAPLHAFVGSFAELVALRFAAGVFSAVSWSAALAWAIGSVPPARRGRTAALINTALPIGAIAGPLFGGPFVQLVGLKAAMGALGVVVLVLGAIASREPEVGAPKHEPVPLRDSIRTVARDSWLLSANVALIVLAIVGTTMQTLGSLHLADHDVSQSGVGAAFTLVAIAGAITTLTIARMADRLDRLKLVGLGTLLMAPAMGAMALPLGTPAFIAAMVAVRDRAGDRLHGLVPARGRRRRARRGRPGRRDGAALGQLGPGRADRPGAHRHGGRAGGRCGRVPARGRTCARGGPGRPLAHPYLSAYSRHLPEGEPSAGATEAIVLESVTKRFDTVVAVDAVSFEIHEGEFFSMLGPSGCGKTTTLRMIAGFEEPTSGRILLRGGDVTHVPPAKRHVNMVFQSYALFPHMSVFENVAFGLRVKRVSRDDVRTRVASALRSVRLEGMEERKPGQLSGGQQQRVALARALVNEPAALLLDEPLGALDLKLRQEMQLELKEIQSRTKTTFVYVTHDQEEALTMSDRIAVMNDGLVEQIAGPRELYEHPSSPFVAGFIGTSNLLSLRVDSADAGLVAMNLGEGERLLARSDARSGETVQITVRPEKIKLGEPAAEGGGRLACTERSPRPSTSAR